MIKQLAHINFYTNRCEAMIDFYINKLELKIKFTLQNEEGIPFCWYLDCGNRSFIEIVDQRRAIKVWGGEVLTNQKGSHYRHLCFEIQNISEYKLKLESKGIQVSQINIGMSKSKQAWIKDPDDNDIELMEYMPESYQVNGRIES